MGKYSLQPDEALLYKGSVSLCGRGSSAEIILTNFNIALNIDINKSIFKKPEYENEVYSIKDIKIYNEEAQIKQRGSDLEIYFTHGELILAFDSKMELSKFKNAITELITGKSMSERGSKKVSETLGLINDALGIDTMETVKGVVEKGVVGTVLGGIGSKSYSRGFSKVGLVKDALGLVGEFTGKSRSDKDENDSLQSQLSYSEKIEIIKKFKELLDDGIISQDEFDAQKKEILGE